MRKVLFFILALLSLLAGLGAFIFFTPSGQDALFERAARVVLSPAPYVPDGLRAVVCGSASPLGNDNNRAQACIAVLTPDHFFLIDVGARSPLRIAQAQLPVDRLTGVLVTHFHSDHIAGIPDVNLASWVRGRDSELAVFGPPGVEEVVTGFNTAYRLDRGYRTAHHGAELLPPDVGKMRARPFTPGEVVWQDSELTVTSFRVQHPPIEPAVGYRIDYKGRSVVVSGDTNPSVELFEIAEGADLLFHDALSRTLLDPMINTAEAANVPVLPQIMRDVIDYHADASLLPREAEKAGIRQLVFYHMVPVPANAIAAQIFMREIPDTVIMAKDLHTFDLAPNSEQVLVHEP